MAHFIFKFVYANPDWTPECRNVIAVSNTLNGNVKLDFELEAGKPGYAILPYEPKVIYEAMAYAYTMNAPSDDAPVYILMVKGNAGDGLYCSRYAPEENTLEWPSERIILNSYQSEWSGHQVRMRERGSFGFVKSRPA